MGHQGDCSLPDVVLEHLRERGSDGAGNANRIVVKAAVRAGPQKKPFQSNMEGFSEPDKSFGSRIWPPFVIGQARIFTATWRKSYPPFLRVLQSLGGTTACNC